MITITSKKDGFRRCGIAHPAVPVEYQDDRFTDAQLEALQAEPLLVVRQDKAEKKTTKTKEV